MRDLETGGDIAAPRLRKRSKVRIDVKEAQPSLPHRRDILAAWGAIPLALVLPALKVPSNAWPWVTLLATAAGVGALVFAFRLRAQANRRHSELVVASEVAQIANELTTPQEMASRALPKIVQMVDGVAGAVCLQETERGRIIASYQISAAEASDLIRFLGKSHPMCVGETAQVVQLGDNNALSLRQRGVAACVSVPLILHDEPLGSICIALRKGASVPPSRLEALGGLARQLALGITRSQALEEANRNLAHLTILGDATLAMSSTTELEDALQVLLEHVCRLPGVVGTAVTLVDGSMGMHRLDEQEGLDSLLAQPGGRTLLNHLSERVLESGSVTSITYSTGTEAAPPKLLSNLGIGSYWGFPLIVEKQTIGVLSVFAAAGGEFDHSLHTFLSTLASQAAATIHNARLYSQATEQLRSLRAARDRLMHSERLSLIGELASGVAHELNNPLTTILGYAQILEEETQNPQMQADLRQIIEAALRSRTIVQGLLSVVRRHEPHREWVDVNQPIQDVLRLKAYQLHVDNIAVETDLATELPKVLADPHQLHQVFLNLVNNAHQAMMRAHGRGRLSLRSYVKEDGTVCVEVADDGPGIPPGLQQRVFEPFFTTKPDGTGLGLSIAQGIVQQHGGSITVESRPGQGCRFFVNIPVVTAAQAVERAEEEREAVEATPQRVLVVEDEPAVADFIAKVLRRAGHDVTVATNGQEALGTLAEAEPDIIITDVKMPTMRGDQFFTELQVLYPQLTSRVIFITGDIANAHTTTFLEENQKPRLVKPFGAEELRRIVAKIAR